MMLLPLLLSLNLSHAAPATNTTMTAKRFRLDSMTGLDVINTKAEPATHRNRRAVRVIDDSTTVTSQDRAGGYALAIIAGSEMENGMIEIDLAGAPRAGAAEGSRGFVGVAFRVQPGGERFECFYLRPTNGRAEDQLRRNHSTQYISQPGYPWHELRKDHPGVYESYVDLLPGEWTRMRIVVAGSSARLFIGDATQPCLIVNDLKQPQEAGLIALWIGDGTEAYFSNLRITPAAK